MFVEICFGELEVMDGGSCEKFDCDIMVTIGQSFFQILKIGILDFKFFNLIVFDESYFVIDKGYFFVIILNYINEFGFDLGF